MDRPLVGVDLSRTGRTLKVWDLSGGAELMTLTGHSNVVVAVAADFNLQRAISASCDATLKVWNLSGGAELMTLTGHINVVAAVAAGFNLQRAISASCDTGAR